METATSPALPLLFQTFGSNAAAIVRNARGDRMAKVVRGKRAPIYIPLDILAVATGRDAWMRGVLVACRECRARVTARDLAGYELCPACYEKAGEEIEAENS